MSLAKIDLDKALNLEFELSVEGVKKTINEIRFVIEGTDRKAVFNGSYTNGIYSVRIPPLENFMESGEHDCYLEVIVDDNRYFKPMTESIEFISPLKVQTSKAKSNTIEEEVKIEGAVRVVEAKEKEESDEEEAKELGFKSTKPDSSYDPEQLKAGTKVEMEHTKNKDMAEMIAKQHLDEDPAYYTKLSKIHKESHEFENKAAAFGYFLDESERFVFSRDKIGTYTGAKNKSNGEFVFFESAVDKAKATLLAVKLTK